MKAQQLFPHLPYSPSFNLNLVLSHSIYPLTMSAGFGLFYVLFVNSYGLILSSYIPIILAAIVITFLEMNFPETQSWRPNSNDLKADTIYMIIVQLLLPRLLVLGFILSATDPIQTNLPSIIQLWPQYWSIVAQVLLMLLLADFFSYWFHRAAHSVPWLWKLHAVHHSPEKLYWLNVGRFHPLEKLLQLSLTTLPFILLGVSESVLALYLVFTQ